MDGGKKPRAGRSTVGLVLELLHTRPLTVAQIAGTFGVTTQQVRNQVRSLRASGLIWQAGTTGEQDAPIWTAKPERGNTLPGAFDGKTRVTAKKVIKFDSVTINWQSAVPTDDREEQDFLDNALDLWGRWMRQKDSRNLSYPPRCTGLAGGWLVKESEELYDAADLRLIRATDAVIGDLPTRERIALWTSEGLCRPERDGSWIVDAMQQARVSVLRGLQAKGFG